ncbi:hypothetical protein HA466_0244380 [Hirschfeldia incana]|nr:hypothetical protein HA466_0244380 [Hirschfeldia incana]
MDAAASGTPSLQYHNLPEQPVSSASSTLVTPMQRQKRQCFGDSTPGEFPLAANPSIVLHVLTECRLNPRDLANLFFFDRKTSPILRQHACSLASQQTLPRTVVYHYLSALLSTCVTNGFLLAGEACCRREKSQAIAGPGHSIAVTSKGQVYTFGHNNSGQLGHGHTEEESKIPIRSLHGIRIIQAAAGAGRTMLISENGSVYTCGKYLFGEAEYGVGQGGSRQVTTPQLVTSLKNIFVVQATIGNFFTAVLSREGKVYTFSWGKDGRLGHQTEANDVETRPLLGLLENVPVVQIAAGYCYLLALACQPNGMSVYSLGCGLGGKLGHGSKPMRIPKVVEGLSHVKAVHVATGDYTTFVVSEEGDVYSFGCGESASLGHHTAVDEQRDRQANVLSPAEVTSLKRVKERVVQISLTNSIYWNAHTFALTESGKLFAFGAGDKGQLGAELGRDRTERCVPERVSIDLS